MKPCPKNRLFRLIFSTIAAPAVLVFTASQVRAVTNYQNTTVDNWTTAANWTGAVPSGVFNQRININGNTTVTFAAAQGTVDAGAASTESRSIVLSNVNPNASAGTATLNITGGILRAGTAATGTSLVGANGVNSVGILNVSGGVLDLTTATAATGRVLAIGLGATSNAGINGTVNLSSSGLIRVGEFRIGDTAPNAGGSITGVLNLNGGTLETALIREPSTGSALVTSTANLNGGLLKFTSTTGISASLDTVNVLSGGANIEVIPSITSNSSKPLLDGGGGGGFTKSGTGTLNMAVAGNTYTGATAIDAGTLNLAAVATFATSAFNVNNAGTLTLSSGSALSNAINVNTGGRLTGEGSTTAAVTFGAGSSLTFDPNTIAANEHFRSTGNINTTAGATTKINLDFSATTTNTGVVIMEGASITSNGISDFNYNARGTLTLTATQLIYDHVAGNLLWKGANGTNPTFWDINTTSQNFTLGGVDNFFFAGDNVTFNDTASNFNPAVQSALTASTLAFSNTTDYTLSGAAVTATSLTKTGSGKVTISNANTLSGGTTISAGTIQLGDGTNATGGLTGAITNNSALIVNFGINDATLSSAISGTGPVTKEGTGKTTLAGTHTYTGNSVINSGTLAFSNTGLGAAGTNLDTLVSGVGNMEKSGAGRMTVDLANTYSGTTTIAAGSIVLDGSGNLGSNAAGTSVASGASLALSGAGTYGTGETLNIIGAGVTAADHFATGAIGSRGAIQSISGSNTYAGNIELGANATIRIGTQDGTALNLTGTITQASGITTAVVLFRAGNGPLLPTPNSGGDFVTLSNAGNSFGGNSFVFTNATTGYSGVRLGIADALPTNLTISGLASTGAGTALDLNGFAQTLNGLNNTATLNIINANTGTPSTLTLNPTADQTTTNTIILGGTGLSGPLGTIHLVKDGTFSQTLTGINTYTGNTTVNAGTLSLGAVNPGNETSTVAIAATGATLNLTFAGADTVDKLFIGGVQQAAGVYEAVGNPGAGTEIAQITGTGTLNVTTGPSAGGYTAWKSANSTSQTIDLDHDNDGVSNGVEYFLGGNTNTTGFTPLPGVVNTLGTLSVTWTKHASYTGTYGTDFLVETSATLAPPWTTEIASPTPSFTVTFPTVNEVKYTFPSGTKNFARLKVTGP